MFSDGKTVSIYGKEFEAEVFEYLLSRFKEAFSHSSLTIESAFKELDELDDTIEKNKSVEAYNYYQMLSFKEKKDIQDILRQIIVFKGVNFGVVQETLDGTQKQFDKIYHNNFEYFDPYLPYYIKFDKNGKFDKRETFKELDVLFYKLPERNNAYVKAYNMLKDNLDAFDYAMQLDQITVLEIIKINSLVNRSDVDKVEGFKKTNNDIFNASFTPTDKKNVPFEMQRLMAEYNENFGETLLDPNESGISQDEKMEHIYKLFRREALFHIRFERIHPFNDGNGRTGRIIMNFNLLKQGLAPVLITNFMSGDYKQYINDYNVESLTKMLVNSSSQQMTNWYSMNKAGISIKKKEINPDNRKLAVIDGYRIEKKGKIFTKKNTKLV